MTAITAMRPNRVLEVLEIRMTSPFRTVRTCGGVAVAASESNRHRAFTASSSMRPKGHEADGLHPQNGTESILDRRRYQGLAALPTGRKGAVRAAGARLHPRQSAGTAVH